MILFLSYPLRWMVAMINCVVVIGLSYCVYLQPLIAKLTELKQKERDLTVRVLAINQSVKQIKAKNSVKVLAEKNAVDKIAELEMIAHASGLDFKTLSTGKLMHLTLQGSFPQFTAFAATMALQTKGLVVGDFTLNVNRQLKHFKQQGLQFALDIPFSTVYLNVAASHQEIKMSDVQNPFCINEATWMSGFEAFASGMDSIAVGNIKMTGFLQQAERRQALLLLPDSRVVAAERGVVIGKEHGVVEEIAKNSVVIVLPDGKKLKIVMS